MNEQDFEQLRQAGNAPALDSQAELTAAKDAIRYALDYYIDDEGAAAEILSFVNGYEGSPDLRINATEPTPARRDFVAELIALRAERDAANAAMLIYREFYEVARDADKVSELTDSTNYDHDSLNLWVDAIEVVKKIRALEGKAE